MLTCIGCLVVALGWLMFETNFLRVRLYCTMFCNEGDCCRWTLSNEFVTPEMKQELINSWTHLPKELQSRFLSGNESPLCGWGFAYQYRDFTPECKVEMNLANVRYSMTIKEPSVMKDIMRVNKVY